MDVSVGPGRGSAAGSTVYCFKITNIDPINTFERFLNPIVYPCPILILTLMMKVVVV
jgi:hypothetical protein